MNTERKYVPVLRWKGAEIDAIAQLDDSVKNHAQPLFEFVPKDFAKLPVERSSALAVRRILQTWGWRQRCFADFSLLEPAKASAAIPHFSRFAHDSLPATLSVTLHPPLEFSVVRELELVKKHGLCFRIAAFEFRQANIGTSILNAAADAGLQPDKVDLVVDFGILQGLVTGLDELTRQIDSIAAWRSVTVLMGAFPPDLSHLEKNNQYEIPRTDWLSYRAYALAGGTAWYGDYTIQHPIFIEREGKGLNFSASIRYSASVHWVIMRGEGVFNDEGPGFEQWPANALMLSHREEFCGPTFSPGDSYIQRMGTQTTVTGGAKEWLTAGINHHLFFVVYQLSNVELTPSAAAVADASAPDWPAQIG